VPDQQEPEELIIDEAPPPDELAREARMTPAQAVAQMRIRVPARGNRKLRSVLDLVNADTELKALWHVSNVNAIARLQINDHSWVHLQIVANIALKLLRQLTKHGVEPSIVADYGFAQADAEIAVLLSALLHDTGMSIHRDNHEDFSLFLAARKGRELLEPSYDEPELTVMVSEVCCTRSRVTALRAGR
jgi:metal-dependent HD superfamily phosphatase/phosphodiesterase